ncbi:tetratricopeptide repeat protein [Endozoicomonas sp. ALB091]|uniref:tetratricopeptide repeat protein n=1 Tax=Endozoicomonas sp. ALB091 TaxID=3403073 RepID=UPI003BB6962F
MIHVLTLKTIKVFALAFLISGCVGMQSDQQTSDRGELYDGTLAADMLGVADASTEREALEKGDSYWLRGDGDRALLYYIRALELNKNAHVAAMKIARVHQQKGNKALAEQAWRTVLAIEPDHVMALEAVGLIRLEQREYGYASDLFNQAIEQWELGLVGTESGSGGYIPWLAVNGLGVIEDLNQNYRSAIAYYRRALVMAPGQAMLLNNLGYSYLLTGQLDQAEAYFRQALSLRSDYPLARHNLALVLTRRNQPNQAVRVLEPVMGEAQARNDVGYLMMLNNRLDVAEALFREAIELSPSYYREAWQNLARLQEG